MTGSTLQPPAPRSGIEGLAAAQIRASNLRALGGLSFSIVLRLLREGLVVRALVWPGLLTALSVFISASFTVAWKGGQFIYVSEPALVAPLEADGFEVTLMPNPESMLLNRTSDRAVWREGDHLVLGVTWAESLKSRAEARLRDITEERWRLELPPPMKRSENTKELRPITGVIAGIVGLLFTLYGVVIGTGALYRDRSSGVLESDLALPVPRWTHAAARLLALAVVLGPALVVSLLVVDSLLAMHELHKWMFDGFVAAVAGGSMGVALMARADAKRGFSGPLSQALMLAMGMISLGYWQADYGRFLPLVSLGSAFATQHSSWVVVPITLALAAAVAFDFHRRECL
ncbi:MAG: ABC transporter permease subunit [Candidatus Binatia bacterium]